MKIGIVGLGLIGGSFAKAVKSLNKYTVLASDINENAFLEAKLLETVDGELTQDNLSECDIVIIAVYPGAVTQYIKQNAAFFKKGSYVIDAAGVKVNICNEIIPIARENGFIFMGGHPMAGTQFSGFKHSRQSLYKDASMILVNSNNAGITQMQFIKQFFMEIGFSEVVFTTAEEHDRIIAFTSQLAHIVSNAYVKSPRAEYHKGFSAGSYKDLTRVAKLNEYMWSELFLENSDNLIIEIDNLIENLSEYRTVIGLGDKQKLIELLRDGRERKEIIERSTTKYRKLIEEV